MTDEVKSEVIKKTQEVLGKFIKKPTLTEKLLKKPPFRFLHDICTSVMKETGFFEQVLHPEDKIENIKDKEGKIEFLQKVIAVVEAASGIKLTVKPNKIVAGLEATKTNEFLQALGKVLEKQQTEKKGLKTSSQVKTKSTNKLGKEVKEEPPDKKKHSDRNSKKIEEIGGNEYNQSMIRSDAQNPVSPKRKYSIKNPEPSTPRNGDQLKQEKQKRTNLDNAFTDREKVQKSNARDGEDLKNVDDVNAVDNIKTSITAGQDNVNFTAKEKTAQSSEQKTEHSGKHKQRRSSIHTVPNEAKISETVENKENLGRETGASGDSLINEKMNLLAKSEFHNKTSSSSGQSDYSKKDTTLVREGTIISRPRTGIRPTTARPASARPAAPRIRDRGDISVTEEIIKPASGKVQVIVDEEIVSEADDENLISLETPNDTALEETTPILPGRNSSLQQEHGHLVEQILEIQKELEDDSQGFSEKKDTGKTEIEWECNKNKEPASREIEKLRANIQSLTRTANPLGKLLYFFQEDIEIIQKELESWKEKNASYSLQIAQEKSITDQYVEPLKIHFKELQKNIDDQMEQINVVKANIIRNNEKIRKLLSGL